MINVNNEFPGAKIRKIKQFKIKKKSYLKKQLYRGKTYTLISLNGTKFRKIQLIRYRSYNQNLHSVFLRSPG